MNQQWGFEPTFGDDEPWRGDLHRDADAWRGETHLPDWPEESAGPEYWMFKAAGDRALF
ncbi:MAG TPA: hypothetical protein VLV16_03405 [Gemmatimonadales bacterium]|nr:hypothetical protein [Gemmatimonadales bacterium]